MEDSLLPCDCFFEISKHINSGSVLKTGYLYVKPSVKRLVMIKFLNFVIIFGYQLIWLWINHGILIAFPRIVLHKNEFIFLL